MVNTAMTLSADLIVRVASLGGRFAFEAGRLRLYVPDELPPDLVEQLRGRCEEIKFLLQHACQPCANPLTPHSAHMYPWECLAESCDCYRLYRFPKLCESVPCRWVWPDRVKQ